MACVAVGLYLLVVGYKGSNSIRTRFGNFSKKYLNRRSVLMMLGEPLVVFLVYVAVNNTQTRVNTEPHQQQTNQNKTKNSRSTPQNVRGFVAPLQ